MNSASFHNIDKKQAKMEM